MAERFPRIVKVQLVVAAVAVVVTIAAALEIPQLLKTKKQLQSEIQFLEERKSEAETSLNALVDKLNKQQTTLIILAWVVQSVIRAALSGGKRDG